MRRVKKVDPKLTQLRQDVAQLDAAIIKLLAKRMRVVTRIGQLKKVQQIPVIDRNLESTIRKQHDRLAYRFNLPPDLVQRIFKEIIKASVKKQKEMTLR